MPRQSTLVAILLLLVAFMAAGTQTAYAHGGHRLVASAAVTIFPAGAEAALVIEAAEESLPTLSMPSSALRGEVSVVANDGTGSASNNCPSAASCCASHCCVAGALVSTAPELPLQFESAVKAFVAASQPDDAPSKTRLRPPCR
jgi:hypothetical protein